VKTYWRSWTSAGSRPGTLNWWVSYPPFPLRNGWLVSKRVQEPGRPGHGASAAALRLLERAPGLVAGGRAARDEAPRPPGMEGGRRDRPHHPHPPDPQRLRVLRGPGPDHRPRGRLALREPAGAGLLDLLPPDRRHQPSGRPLPRPESLRGANETGAGGGLRKVEEERLDREFARVLRPLYEQMDRTIAKYLGRMDGKTLLVVCSDHGFRFFQGAYSHANPAQEPPDGVVFVAGREFARASAWMGRPSTTSPDHPVRARPSPPRRTWTAPSPFRLRPALAEAVPVRTIASYETRPRDAAPGGASNPDVDKDVLQDLSTIGYIGGDEAEAVTLASAGSATIVGAGTLLTRPPVGARAIVLASSRVGSNARMPEPFPQSRRRAHPRAPWRARGGIAVVDCPRNPTATRTAWPATSSGGATRWSRCIHARRRSSGEGLSPRPGRPRAARPRGRLPAQRCPVRDRRRCPGRRAPALWFQLGCVDEAGRAARPPRASPWSWTAA